MKTEFPAIEMLESRIAPATLIVSTLKDITDTAHDTGSLRDAIFLADATPGVTDNIVFQKIGGAPLTGTIKLASALPEITDSLTIQGPVAGKSNGLTINGNNHQIFNVTGGNFTLADLTVSDGQALKGGGFYINDSTGTAGLTDVTITGNHAIAPNADHPSYGGGLWIGATSQVTISHSKITGNFSTGARGNASYRLGVGGGAYGGGIFCRGTLTLTNSTVSGNAAQAGNAQPGTGEDGGGAFGGGIYASLTAANVTIQNSVISGNKALGGNGSAYIDDNGGRGGNGNGGGIYDVQGAVLVTNSTISKNLGKGGNGANGGKGSSGGGSGYADGGGVSGTEAGASVTLQSCIISGNKVTAGKAGKAGKGGEAGLQVGSFGAGIYSDETLNISTTTIAKNSADYGGGISIYGGTANINACTISQNMAAFDGGGLDASRGTIAIHSSTIAQNSASRDGGGLINLSATLTIHNSTIAQNKASGTGGGLKIGHATEIISTIIAGNTARTDADLNSAAAADVTASFNLIQHVTAGTLFTDNGKNILNANPLLGKLLNNGGPTQTILPGADSPVIDKGSDPDNIVGTTNTDQRGTGFPRKLGAGIDIGAVEVG